MRFCRPGQAFLYILLILTIGAARTAAQTPTIEVPVAAEIKFEPEKITYGKLITEEVLFLSFRAACRMTQEKTWREMDGNFFNDWFDSAGVLFTDPRWNDGGKSFTNYVSHPMMGSGAANIFRQNDPVSKNAKFGWNKQYARAKGRQFVFATIDSFLFEIGPLSESSIGNIKQGWGDIVLTPTLGIAWSVGEDALRNYILDPLYPRHKNWANTLALFLNPTRSFANMMAFKKPWSRE
jgi:hypothetical protein